MAAESKTRKEATPSDPVRRPWMAGIDIVTSVLLLIAIWVALPARWWPVDVFGTLLAMLFAFAGVGLLTAQPWGERVARVVAAISLGSGSLLVLALAYTAGSISGLYGPVGAGGALILGAVAALALPYLVIFPAAQLYVLLRPEP